MICFLQTVRPVTLHVGNLKVIDITQKNANKILSMMNNNRWNSLRILDDGRSTLCEKIITQCNGTRILPGKCQSTVRVFLTVHNNNNDITTCI